MKKFYFLINQYNKAKDYYTDSLGDLLESFRSIQVLFDEYLIRILRARFLEAELEERLGCSEYPGTAQALITIVQDGKLARSDASEEVLGLYFVDGRGLTTRILLRDLPQMLYRRLIMAGLELELVAIVQNLLLLVIGLGRLLLQILTDPMRTLQNELVVVQSWMVRPLHLKFK